MGDENFAYFSPSEQLKTLISNYTITFPIKGVISDDYTIVPHGSATLVLTYDGADLRSLIFGPSSKPYFVGKNANACSVIFIIEFQPAGLFVFTGTKQNQLMDTIISLEQIAPRLDSSIKEIFCNAGTAEELLTRIESLLLCSQCSQYPAEFRLAVQLIIQSNGNISLKDITEKTFYSERHLNRLSNHYLGFNLKHFPELCVSTKPFICCTIRATASIIYLPNPVFMIFLILSGILGPYAALLLRNTETTCPIFTVRSQSFRL